MELISREAAIEAIEELKNRYLDRKVVLAKAQDAVNNLPTAEKVGKWIEVKNKWGGLGIICSECGAKVPRDGWGNAMQSDYCCRCGARMTEGEEDDNM